MGRTIIHSVTLFDGWSMHPNSAVLFDSSSGLIESVQRGTSDSTSVPSETNAIDGTGHTLIPGLIEGHMHSYAIHMPEGVSNDTVLTTPLKCGITTVCDMHSDPPCVQGLQKQVKEDYEQARRKGSDGRVTMADLKSSHFGATIEGGWPKPIVLGHDPAEETVEFVKTWPNLTVETATDFVKSHKAEGADYIKLMQENCCSLALPTDSVPSATLELQTAVVNAGHDEGMIVVGHATSVDSTKILLQAGADGMTHTFIDQAPTEEIIELYKKTGAFVIPTLTVLASLTGEEQELREKFANIARNRGLLDDLYYENMISILGMKAPEAKLEYAYETIKRLRKEGIDIVAGTDAVSGLKGTAIGPSMWMELDLYVSKCDMTPVEALSAATAVSAKRFGFNDRGTIQEGKRADMVLLKGSITKSLVSLWDKGGIAKIWKTGKLA